jgi:hypothetical protein
MHAAASAQTKPSVRPFTAGETGLRESIGSQRTAGSGPEQ